LDGTEFAELIRDFRHLPFHLGHFASKYVLQSWLFPYKLIKSQNYLGKISDLQKYFDSVLNLFN
jgi:hypothetical protein